MDEQQRRQKEPQSWFKPVMEEGRPIIELEKAETLGINIINDVEVSIWDDEYEKQKYIQWPAAWADAILETI